MKSAAAAKNYFSSTDYYASCPGDWLGKGAEMLGLHGADNAMHFHSLADIRVHSSGDFLDAAYAEKWLSVMKQCPKPRYYWYSRSWRCPDVAPVLEQMAALKCCRARYSVDAQTGLPKHVPPGVRLAHLQPVEDEEPELYDLLFRVRRLRGTPRRVSLPMTCPQETPEGKARDMNCGSCQRCWRD